MNFSTCLSAWEAQAVSSPWVSDAQGHIGRSGDPGWTEGEGRGGESLPCVGSPFPSVSHHFFYSRPRAVLTVQIIKCVCTALKCFLQSHRDTLVAPQTFLSLPFPLCLPLGSNFCSVRFPDPLMPPSLAHEPRSSTLHSARSFQGGGVCLCSKSTWRNPLGH